MIYFLCALNGLREIIRVEILKSTNGCYAAAWSVTYDSVFLFPQGEGEADLESALLKITEPHGEELSQG